MASEIIRRDENSITVLAGITADSAGEIRNLQVNPVTGRLLVTSGAGGGISIGSSVTGATPGSVLFVDGSGLLGEDNPQFFYDDVGNVLGVGTSSPSAKLHLVNDTSFAPVTLQTDSTWNTALTTFVALQHSVTDTSSANNSILEQFSVNSNVKYYLNKNSQLVLQPSSQAITGLNSVIETFGEATTNNQRFLFVQTVSSTTPTDSGGLITFKSGGTLAAKTATLQADTLLILGGRGYDGASFGSNSKAVIQFKAAENWTAANQGTYITFETTPTLGFTRVERMRIGPGNTIGVLSGDGIGIFNVNVGFFAGTGNVDGTIGTNTLVNVGGNFVTQLKVGDEIIIGNNRKRIATIIDANNLTINGTWETTFTAVNFSFTRPALTILNSSTVNGYAGFGLIAPTSRIHAHSQQGNTIPIATIENNVGKSQSFVSTITPEAVITGNVGDYTTDVTTGSFYTKVTGTGTNTGWLDDKEFQLCAVSVNTKNVASTILYAVPAGKNAIITKIIFRCTAAVAITAGATISIGNNSTPFDNVLTATTLTGLTTVGQSYVISQIGKSTDQFAGSVVRANVTVVATGTSQTVQTILYGILI